MMSNILDIQLILIILIFLLALPLSYSEDSRYEACSTLYSCGNIRNVGYPFWGGNRPVYCGVQDFRLNCLNGDEYPTMVVYTGGSLGLTVMEINTSSTTLSVLRNNLLASCYMQDTSNISLISSLSPDRSYRTVNLFYGCSSCVSSLQSKNFTCTNSNDHTTHLVYYFENSSDISMFGNNSCSCENNVSVPVDQRGLDELQNITFSLWNILTDWPVRLEYSVDIEACRNCEDSGGRCGSSVDNPSSDEFLCYCPEGPHPSACTQSGGRRTLIIVGSGVAAVLGIVLLFAVVIFVQRKRRNNTFSFIWSPRTEGDQNISAILESYGSLTPKRYTYKEIRKMTNSFKDKLGEGGYGSVYKGKLHDDRLVAVKKLKILGDDGKEFFNEVLSISKTSHVNIVTFLGFCFEGKNRALVFEFLPNGSLEKFVFGKNNQSLECETMFKIAVGIARGLDYLHNGCNTKILHFDIKPHNILLDEEFHPKISDFGLARLCQPKNSMVSMSQVRGTLGYMAPEIFSRSFGNISQKSDVYSYGMMLLDLVCGEKKKKFDAKSNTEVYFPEWVYNHLEPMDEEVVQEMMNDREKELERKMILVSLWCIQTYPSSRPPMNRVVEMLEGSLESLQMPPKPYIASPERVVFDDDSSLSTM